MTKDEQNLAEEVAYRERLGIERVSLAELDARLARLGYKRDPASRCTSTHRHITGDRAGQSYQGCTWGVIEIDTGRSFANVDARRDANFMALQALRSAQTYVVQRGWIVGL